MTIVVRLPGAKRPLIAGLRWLAFESLPSKELLRKLAAAYGKWAAVRTNAAQVGFCPDCDTDPNASSLAAAVAGSKPAPWRGIYKIGPESWWYIAVGAGEQVLPDGDVVGDLPTLKALWEEHGALIAWTTEVDGTADDLLDAVNAAAPADLVALREIGGAPWLFKPLWIGVFGAAVALSVGGYWVWHRHVSAAERARELAAMRARLIRPAPKVVPPWTGKVMAEDGFAACRTAWNAQRLSWRGWVLAEWVCSVPGAAGNVESSWLREGGLSVDAPGRAVDGNHSINSARISVERSAASDALNPQAREAVMSAMWTAGQRWGYSVIVTNAGARTRARGAINRHGKPAAPLFVSAAVKLMLPMAPWLYPASAFDIAGLRVDRVGTDLSHNDWIVVGTIYCKGP